MNGEEYLNKLHKEILDIMDEIDRICKENHLKYYLIGGTLLGAIRHGGFIPWDDDLDIVMPRGDYEQFIQLAPQFLKEQFDLQWITSNRKYWLQFAKVCKKQTLFGESDYYTKNRAFGIFVDIFPIDETKGVNVSVKIRKWIVQKCKAMMIIKVIKGDKNPIKRMVLNIFSVVSINHVMTLAMKGICRKGDYYTNFGSQYNIKKQTIRKEFFGPGKRIVFEDREYLAPVDPQAVLTSIFGRNYMQLPPPEKRRTHYPVKVIFSDGEAIDFERQTEKIKVER